MSRLHRGRRLLKTHLYEHARAMGIIGPEPLVGEEPADTASKPEPIDLASWRARKVGAR
jgi:hypothetical protein